MKASSSIGRAPVSKTGCWGFESLLACHLRGHRFVTAKWCFALGTKGKSLQNAANAEGESRLDGLKWVVVALVVAGGVGGNIYFSEESLLYRVIALLVLALVAGFVAAQTARGAAFLDLVKGALNEIRKVVWPTLQAGTQTTLIVLAFVILAALILWGLDSLLGWLASMVIG